MSELIRTFKFLHELVARLWVEAGADEGEDGQLLHLLFIRCGDKNTLCKPGNSKSVKLSPGYGSLTTASHCKAVSQINKYASGISLLEYCKLERKRMLSNLPSDDRFVNDQLSADVSALLLNNSWD